MEAVVVAVGVILIILVVIAAVKASETSANEGQEAQDAPQSDENARLDALQRRAEQLIAQPLQSVTAPFSLKRGEVCHFSSQAVLFENRKVRTGTAFAGPTISIPIIRSIGLRFRAGYFSHAPNSHDQLVPLDQGTLSITNRSLTFIGEKGSKTVKLQDILRTDKAESPNPQAVPFLIAISRKTGRTQFYAIEDPLAALVVLAKTTNSLCE